MTAKESQAAFFPRRAIRTLSEVQLTAVIERLAAGEIAEGEKVRCLLRHRGFSFRALEPGMFAVMAKCGCLWLFVGVDEIIHLGHANNLNVESALSIFAAE